jgi:hypothetical protein
LCTYSDAGDNDFGITPQIILLTGSLELYFAFTKYTFYLLDYYYYYYLSEAVDTVVCAPVDGWRYHPKQVEQFADIKTVKLHFLGRILE